MNYEHKLDALQKMAKAYTDESHKIYVIELLAEHAEEAEMTTAFLEWLQNILHSSCLSDIR